MKYDTGSSFAKSYEKHFKIGSCFRPQQPELMKKHFNSLVDEGAMKWAGIEPEDGVFRFDGPDRLVAFARENNMAVRAHAPVWHHSTNDWVFKDGDKKASRELLIERMDRHTKVFAEHFRDDIYCWDVTNEVIEDRGSELLRKTDWLDGIGEDYIDIAYTLARKYAPNVQLFYNDYGEWRPEKRDKIVKLMRGMQERGVPLDGFGLQAHISEIWNFPLDDYKRAIEAYASLGLRLHITELDISVYNTADRSLPPPPLQDETFERQAQLYKDLFEIFRSYSDVIDNVTFWGASDDLSWIDGWVFKDGRKGYPLPFYYDHTPKPFTKEIIQAALDGK